MKVLSFLIAFNVLGIGVLTLGVPMYAQQVPTAPKGSEGKSLFITDLEQSQLREYTAEIALIESRAQNAITPLEGRRAQLIDDILKNNPGYVWHQSQGVNDPDRFEYNPKVAAPAKAVTPAATKK